MIVVRFREGRDDELREWYESLPKGDRSRVVRDILKKHVKGEPNINVTNNVKNNTKQERNINVERRVDRLMEGF